MTATDNQRSSRSAWKLTPWGIISCLLLLALDLTPAAALILGLLVSHKHAAWLIITAFLILSFWPSTFVVVRAALRARELPRITGGPGFMWAAKPHRSGLR